MLNTKVYDEVIKVASDDAVKMAKRLGVEEGLFCGISSGAATLAAVQVRFLSAPLQRHFTGLGL